MKHQRLELAVIGGSSPGTAVLLDALRRSQRCSRLPAIRVRLHGRSAQRLERIREYAVQLLSVQEGDADAVQFEVSVHTRLREALRGSSHILCQVRPGGMEGRTRDEQLARFAGAPADEGIGVGGLACFLRSRELMRALATECRRWAPDAVLLQMTSPLGFNVALGLREFGPRSYGVCELASVTARALVAHVGPKIGTRTVNHRYAGLNHQGWIYAFSNGAGQDITDTVLAAVDDAGLVGVAPQEIRRQGAVPVPYLRMYLETAQVLALQAARPVTRGEELARWRERVDAALCSGPRPDAAALARLLSERRMNWYEDGVLPVLEALFRREPTQLPLNVAAGAAFSLAAPNEVVETDCELSSHGVRPVPAPDLPPRPRALVRRLLAYERAALALPARPGRADIGEVLALHPLVPSRSITLLATELGRLRPECAEIP